MKLRIFRLSLSILIAVSSCFILIGMISTARIQSAQKPVQAEPDINPQVTRSTREELQQPAAPHSLTPIPDQQESVLASMETYPNASVPLTTSLLTNLSRKLNISRFSMPSLLLQNPAKTVVGPIESSSAAEMANPGPTSEKIEISSADMEALSAPVSADLSGSPAGYIGENLAYSAVVQPLTATLPLFYTWQAQSQTQIAHSGGLTDSVAFTWFSLGDKRITVTITNTAGSVTDIFTTTILEEPISGLAGSSSAPTPLGETTAFTATILTGSNVSYTWDFGDSSVGSGDAASHIYLSTGVYTVTLLAQNSLAAITTSLQVSIKEIPVISLPDFSAVEGTAKTITGTFTDPDSAVWNGVVDYGDGSTPETLTINPDQTFTLTHIFPDSLTYNVSVDIYDEISGHGSTSATATVSNVAPTAVLTNTSLANEGGPALMALSSPFDPSAADTSAGLLYSYDFDADGTYEITNSLSPSQVIPAAYIPDGPFTYTLRARISDKDFGENVYTSTIAVANVAPILASIASPDSDENSAAELSGLIVDPGSSDTFTLTVDWGDGTNNIFTYPSGTSSFLETHIYPDDDPTGTATDMYTITIHVEDKDKAADTAGSAITIHNVAPGFSNLAATPITENGTTTLSGLIVEPSALDPITLTIAWGDGNSQVFTYTAGTSSFSLTHQFLDDNPTRTASDNIPIGLTIQDDDLGTTVSSTNLVISNANPTLSNVTASNISEMGTTTLTGQINDIGIQDTYTMTVTWGDGAVDVFTYPASTSSFTQTHQYLDDDPSGTLQDIQTILVSLSDDDLGTATASPDSTITNLPPTLSGLSATGISENGLTALTGFITDTGVQDTFILTVTWGDGTSSVFNYSAGTTAFTQTHRYLDDNLADLFTISAVLSDDDMGKDSASTTVSVANVAPSLSNLTINSSVTENFTATLTGNINDPGSLDTFTLLVNWGDGTSPVSYNYPAGTTAFSVQHKYLDDKPTATASDINTVNLTITDDDGGSGSASRTLTVNNTAPALSNVSIDPLIYENDTASLTGKIIDPGSQDTFSLHVTWGDGLSNTYPYPAGTTNFTVTHKYLDDNPSGTSIDSYSVALTVTDDDLGTGSSSSSLFVSNVSPSFGTVSAGNILENGTATLTGSITEPGSKDPFTLTVNWGDGSTEYFTLAANTKTFSKTHQYLDDNPTKTSSDNFTINLALQDDDLGSDTALTTLKVTNVAPTLSNLTAPNISENSTTTLAGTIVDPGTRDNFTMTVAWGDGQSDTLYLAAGATAFSKTHQYKDDDPTRTSSDTYSIQMTIIDDDLGSNSFTKNLTISNVAPVISGVSATPISENNITSLTGTISDPGTRDYFTMTVSWGDGATSVFYYPSTLLNNGSFQFTATHQYLDDNPTGTSSDNYTINLSVTDDDLGVGTAQASLVLSNTAPSLTQISITPVIFENSTATLAGTIVDPGTLDSFSITVNWGDQTSSTTNFSAGTTTFQITHQYLDDNPTNTPSDVYLVNITVTDDDLGQGTASTSLTVFNTTPSLSALSATSVNENGISTLTGQINDVGTKDSFSMIVAWGDGTSTTYPFPAGTKTFSKTHQYLDDNPSGTTSDRYTISIVVTDDDLGQGAGSTSLNVSNVSPALLNLFATSVDENGVSTLTGKISDPGSLDTFSLAVGWGDGVTDLVAYPAGATDFSLTHTYLDDEPGGTSSDTYAISIILMDDDQGSSTGSASHTITNVDPVLSNLAISSIAENNFATLTGNITDPGTLDTFTLAVDWGDSTSSSYTYTVGTHAFTETHRYLDNGVFTATLNLEDDDLGQDTKSVLAVVSNILPGVTGLAATNISENNSTTLSGMIVDPGTLDTFTMTVTWGDGSSNTYLFPAGTTTFARTHQYLDDNPTATPADLYSISVQVEDKDTGIGLASASLTVSNTAPTISNLTASSTNENSFTSLTGKIVDPGSKDTFTMTITWGDGSSSQYLFPAGTTVFTKTHQYLDDNPTNTNTDLYPVSIAITDDDKGAGAASTNVRVNNVNPIISNLLATSSLQEGGILTLSGSIVDPGSKDTFGLTVDWGDGSTSQFAYGMGTSAFSQTHLYKDDNPSNTASDLYTITVTVLDDDLGASTGQALFIIHNVVPQITNLSLSPAISENGSATLSGKIVDPGILDTFSMAVTWGDGYSNSYTFTAGTTNFSLVHKYLDDNPSITSSDIYTVGLNLADDDLGSAVAAASISVANTAPSLQNVSLSSIAENESSTLTATIQDPGTLDTFTLVVDWGDGSTDSYPLSAGTSVFTQTHQYLDDNPTGTSVDQYNVSLSLSDDDSGQASTAASVSVSNSNPVLSFLSATNVMENGISTLSGKIFDQGSQDSFRLFVTWGDGVSDVYTYTAGTTDFAESHQYLDDDPSGTSSDLYTIDLILLDDDQGQAVGQTTLTVSNAAPSITNLAAANITENGTAILSGSFTDVGTQDTFTITIEWGDGTTDIYPLIAGTTTFSKAHKYLDDDPSGTTSDQYPIRVTIQDDDSGQNSSSRMITVSNTIPSLQNLSVVNINENALAVLTGKITDPGTKDTFTMTINWGDGKSNVYLLAAGTTTFSKSHKYLDDNPSGTVSDVYTINITVKDDDAGQVSSAVNLIVSNVAPALVNLSMTNISENGLAVMTGKIVDPGTLDTFTLQVDWGDGSQMSFSYPKGTTQFTQTHTYLDDNPTGSTADLYIVSLEIQDDDLGLASYTTSLTVTNQAPAIANLSAADIFENQTTQLTGQFFDPGLQDTFTMTIDWGDGTSNTFSPLTASINGTLVFTQTHLYTDDNPSLTKADPYTLTITVTDDDQGSDTSNISIIVTNIAPQINLSAVNSLEEGQSFNVSGSFSDPGSDTWSGVVNYGDGLGVWPLLLSSSKTFTLNWVYDDDGSKIITLDIQDDDTGEGVLTQTVTVHNVAPTAFFSGTASVIEGQPGMVWFDQISDPSQADTIAGFNFSYDFNLDGFFDIFASNSPSATIPAYILANGPSVVLVRGRIEDKDHGFTDYLTTITVIDAPPVANSDTYTILEDHTLLTPVPGVLFNDTDVPADVLSALVETPPNHGLLTLDPDGSFSYIPFANYFGVDVFSYQAQSGGLLSQPAPVTITITAVNDSPITVSDHYTTTEDLLLQVAANLGVLSNDSDVEGQSLTASLIQTTQFGVLTFKSNGSFNYQPAQGFFGKDTFRYKASDGVALSSSTVVTITINALPNEPLAADDDYTAFQTQQLVVSAPGVLANDTLYRGTGLTAILVSQPLHGDLLFMPDGSFKYTSNRTFSGLDTFTYAARDSLGNLSTPAVVRIQVNRLPEDLFSFEYLFISNPAVPHASMPAELAMTVMRTGGASSLVNQVEVWFYLDTITTTSRVGMTTLSQLLPDSGAQTNPIAWLPAVTGDHTLYAVIDPQDLVTEADETNNVISRAVTILPAPNPVDFINPEINMFKANLGDALTGDRQITLYLTASDTGSQVTRALFAEYVYSQTLNAWTPVQVSAWLPFSGNSTNYPWAITAAPGVHYVISWVSDQFGNISDPKMTHINYNPQLVTVAQNQVVIYRFALSPGQIFTATLSSISGDADLYAFSPLRVGGTRDLLGASYSTGTQDQVVIRTTESGVYQLEVEGYSASDYSLAFQISSLPATDLPENMPFPGKPSSKARSVPINSSDPVQDYPLPAPYPVKKIYIPMLMR